MRKFLKNLNLMLLQSLSGMFFLINPSAEVVREDYSKLIDSTRIERPFETGDQYFKTPEEIDKFFLSTRGLKKKNITAYLKIYKPLMLSASNIFKIPFSFQSCLIFRESRFNKKAISPVGAMGVAQFTGDTYDFLSRALRIGKSSLESQGKRMLEAGNFSFVELDGKELSYSKYNVKIFSEMHRMWQAYLINNDLEELNLGKLSFETVLYKPRYAIGLSSMYLYYLKHRVKYDIRKHVADKDLDHPDFILSVAGAYNQGAGRVLRIVKKNKKKPDFLKWISYQSKVDETKNYITSIRSCMKKDHKGSKEGYALQVEEKAKEKSTFN